MNKFEKGLIISLIVSNGFFAIALFKQGDRTNKNIEELMIPILAAQNRTQTQTREWHEEAITMYNISRFIMQKYDSLNVEIDKKLNILKRK